MLNVTIIMATKNKRKHHNRLKLDIELEKYVKIII